MDRVTSRVTPRFLTFSINQSRDVRVNFNESGTIKLGGSAGELQHFCFVVVQFQFVESHTVSDSEDAGFNGLDGTRCFRLVESQVDLSAVSLHMKA